MVMPAHPTEQSQPLVPHWNRGAMSTQLRAIVKQKSHFSHPSLFIPKARRDDGWLPFLHEAQNPARCERYLLVEDDMHRSGLGFTARMLASLLLFAVRESRVLLEVPRKNADTGRPTGRWCDRSPHTLQCAFEPWSSCSLPNATMPVLSLDTACTCISRAIKGPEGNVSWEHRKDCAGTRDSLVQRHSCARHLVASNTAVVSIGLTHFYRLQGFWSRPGDDAFSVLRAAHRFLFAPRPWVRDLAACVQEQYGLRGGKFLTVHVRNSPEKKEEMRKAGKRMPNEAAYLQLTALAANASGLRRVLLQTAHPDSLSKVVAWAKTANIRVGFTDNPRAEGDAWGGWSAEASMTSTQMAVAAVNAHIASQAALLISPSLSLWTAYLMHQMGYDAHSAAWPPIRSPRPEYPWLSSELDETSYCCGARESYLKIVTRHTTVPPGASELIWNSTKDAKEGCSGRSTFFAAKFSAPPP